MIYDRDDVLARVDLAELADQLLAPRHPRTRSWPCPNPQHKQTGRTPPVTIFDDRRGGQRWHCHVCGEGGTAIDLTIKAGAATDFREALHWLATRTNVQPMHDRRPVRAARASHATRPRARPDDAHVRRALSDYAAGCAAHLRSADAAEVRRWLTEVRGLPWDVVEHSGIGADPGERSLPRPDGVPRVVPAAVFPVRAGDEVIFTQSRLLRPRNGGPRWISTAARVAPNPRIAFFDPPRHRADGPLVVTEGVVDALSAVSAGYRSAALLGTGVINDNVIAQLVQRGERLILLAMDNDNAGHMAREQLVARLGQQGVGAGVLHIPERFNDLNDWHVACREDWPKVLRQSCRLAPCQMWSGGRPTGVQLHV